MLDQQVGHQPDYCDNEYRFEHGGLRFYGEIDLDAPVEKYARIIGEIHPKDVPAAAFRHIPFVE